jgi:hypothetical protein
MGTRKATGKPAVNRREKDLPLKRTTDVTGFRGRYQVRLDQATDALKPTPTK